METKVQFNVLETIENVYKYSKDSNLREPLFEVLQSDLQKLSAYFDITEIQAVIMSNAFIFSYGNSSLSAVFNYFGFEDYKLVFYNKEVEVLFKKKLLFKSRNFDVKSMDYKLCRELVFSITKNLELPANDDSENSLIDIIELYSAQIDLFKNDAITKNEFYDFVQSILDDYEDNEVIQKIIQWKLTAFESYFFLETIKDALEIGDNDYNTDVQLTIEDYKPRKGTQIDLTENLINGKSKLTSFQLIEFSNSQYRNRTKAKLTNSALKLLKEKENIRLEYFEDENKKLIQHKNIKKKELLYNESEVSSVEILQKTLSEIQFKKLQKRLNQKALPLGITVLLHGDPGTGKTESVYQLAKSSGRNIFKVDISETKSMWFGESQKLVKKIFTDYEELKKEEKRCPILLFNEADAIIGKRKSAGSSNIADTENAIQNILLEELEKFDGILFATTNLVDNMDAAFERRFLYKIRFSKPELKNAARIWNLKLPFLSEPQAEQLASEFQFSGGEMENIARKILMEEVLNNQKPTLKQVLDFCRSEKWGSQKKAVKIGF